VGRAIAQLPAAPRRIGVVGLGAGVLAIYGRPGDAIRFYEINPAVEALARTYFTFLAGARAAGVKVEEVMGDARLSLEREADQGYDLLVLDAFSGDSVPLHLLTTQAFDIYLRHLRPDGILAVHASVTHVNVPLVVMRLAEHLGLVSYLMHDDGDPGLGTLPSTWVLVGRPRSRVDCEDIRRAAEPPPANLSRVAVWTDDYTNVVQVIR
jgi:hypothetical protein